MGTIADTALVSAALSVHTELTFKTWSKPHHMRFHSSLSFNAIRDQVCAMYFPNHYMVAGPKSTASFQKLFKLSYRDDENDDCLVQSEIELLEAKRIAHGLKLPFLPLKVIPNASMIPTHPLDEDTYKSIDMYSLDIETIGVTTTPALAETTAAPAETTTTTTTSTSTPLSTLESPGVIETKDKKSNIQMCSACDSWPMDYMCLFCETYYLCGKCESNNINTHCNTHPLVKAQSPDMIQVWKEAWQRECNLSKKTSLLSSSSAMHQICGQVLQPRKSVV